MLEAGFWDNQELAQEVTREVSSLKSTLQKWNRIHGLYEDGTTLLELWEETEDESLQAELSSALPSLERAVEELELTSLLSGEYDGNNAILTIHPGAGAPNPRIGPPCCTGCIPAGRKIGAIKWKCSTTSRG